MRYDDLSDLDLAVLKRMLVEAICIWDGESSTLYGLSKDEVTKITVEWPACLEEDEFRAALAVNNICADFLGGSTAWTYAPDRFPSAFGATYAEVDMLFQRMKPRLGTAVHEK
jgi:hypothetical protein